MTFFLNRKNEKDMAPPSRTDRFYRIGNEWYFGVRRGQDRGPFKSQTDARAALKSFIMERLADEKHHFRDNARSSMQQSI